jgi:superfamily II DNA or RNA helicase
VTDRPIAIALTPAGHVVLREAEVGEPAPDAHAARRIRAAFERGQGTGLLHLGVAEARAELPPAFAFWRDFGRDFVATLCSAADLEERREHAEPLPREGELLRLSAAAPPMPGAEYLSPEVLGTLWTDVLEAWRSEIARHRGTVQAWLTAQDDAWSVVGRVHLHLAENRRDPERPFAFLATYTTGLAASGKPQHRPLGEAVREASSAADRRRLLALLAPVQRASERSALVKALADSGRLFHPQSWTADEAYRFLREVPALEESGVVVRVPDWWSGRRPQPRVMVSIGERKPAGLGLDAVLDFSARLALGDEEVSESELRALREGPSGLRLLKGRWVEVDREKLDEVLRRWREARRAAGDGLSFVEAMRLLAGAGLPGDAWEAAAEREWAGIVPGAWLAEALAALRGAKGAAEADPGDALRATLRPYQRDGVRWLWTLSRLGLGGCLADDMGLGKTIQVLALLLLLKRHRLVSGPHLLVVPASLLANWSAEAARFAPSLRVLVAHPSATPREELATLAPDALARHDVVITSYGSVHRLPWVAATRWGLVALDEAQAVKNPAARQTRAVKALPARLRLALTGTPVENRAADLWSIFDFVNPGLLGSAKGFGAFLKRASAEVPAPGARVGEAPASPYAALRELVRPYILRRLKTDRAIIADLPEKTEVKAFCSLSRRQAALYEESVEELGREIASVDPADRMKRRGLVLSYLLRLKQICNHPSQWLGDGAYDPAESGKLARLREIAEVVASRQEKALVFTQFREMAAPLARFLAGPFGRPGLVLTGETRVKERAELVRRFQEDEAIPFLVLSLKAGGTGLNLTAATHVVHFDRWWNPAVENQATDRAFRIGQTRGVLVHKLVCRGTVEERIDAMLEEKQQLAREIVEDGGEVRLTELDDRELLRLVSLDLEAATADG